MRIVLKNLIYTNNKCKKRKNKNQKKNLLNLTEDDKTKNTKENYEKDTVKRGKKSKEYLKCYISFFLPSHGCSVGNPVFRAYDTCRTESEPDEKLGLAHPSKSLIS